LAHILDGGHVSRISLALFIAALALLAFAYPALAGLVR
jgi:hypothetical protein